MPVEVPEFVGQYRVIKELGRGSMGTVYLALQESLGRELAIKQLATEFTRDEEFVERFKREGKIAAKLRHPYIVQVFDFSDRDYYIAMEYLGDQNLKQFLEVAGGKLPIDRALKIADQLLQALHHAHSQGVVHRDVKPANIMMTERNEATLTDFSIAQMKFATRLTQAGAAVGTPEYMAPEQFDGRTIDGRADVYAVGLILYEMLTGAHPFHGDTISEVMKGQLFKEPLPPHLVDATIPKALSLVIMGALQKKAEDRHSGAEEMRQALLPIANAHLTPTGSTLDQFLADVASGKISLDDANNAREKVKEAIDRGFRKNLTFMMVDLAGSSKIKVSGQTLHADRAFRDYRATINAVLKEHQCMSYEWAGDGAICIFSLPLQAVQAAVKIQSLVDEVGARHAELPEKLRARIGINTGEVYLDPRRGLGEFASRTVDQAGHLEKDCPVGCIRVSKSTMEQTGGAIEYQEIGLNRDDLMVYQVHESAVLSTVRGAGARKARVRTGVGEKPVAPALTEKFRLCPRCSYKMLAELNVCARCGQGDLLKTAEKPEPVRILAERPAVVTRDGVRETVTLDPDPLNRPAKQSPRRRGTHYLLAYQMPTALAVTGCISAFLGLLGLMEVPWAPGPPGYSFVTGVTGLAIMGFASLGLTAFLWSSGEGGRRTFAQLLMTVGLGIALAVLLNAGQ